MAVRLSALRALPKSVTELLSIEEKRFVQGGSYFVNKIPICILKLKLDMQEKKKKQMYKILIVYSQTLVKIRAVP
jgi:hypothetical protein